MSAAAAVLRPICPQRFLGLNLYRYLPTREAELDLLVHCGSKLPDPRRRDTSLLVPALTIDRMVQVRNNSSPRGLRLGRPTPSSLGKWASNPNKLPSHRKFNDGETSIVDRRADEFQSPFAKGFLQLPSLGSPLGSLRTQV